MTSPGAYQDEMAVFLKLSDEELARLLAGEVSEGNDALEQVASLCTEIRGELVPPVVDETERARHLTAMIIASQRSIELSATQRPARPKWKSMFDRPVALAMKVIASTVAASMSLMGLAYAGVDLPGRVPERAIEAVTGVELPNQDAPEPVGESSQSEEAGSVSDEVQVIVESALEGCERGQAIADAADANRQFDTFAPVDPCAQGQPAVTTPAEENLVFGRWTAGERSDSRSETKGDDTSDKDKSKDKDKDKRKSKGSNKSGGASEAQEDNAGTNDDAGRAKAEEASQDVVDPTERKPNDPAGTKDDAGRAAREASTSTRRMVQKVVRKVRSETSNDRSADKSKERKRP